MNKRSYYQTKDGKSLYLFSLEYNLNVYEFDLLKRIVRDKNYLEDLRKTYDLLDIYKMEYNQKYYLPNSIDFYVITYFLHNWNVSDNDKKKIVSKILTLRNTDSYTQFLENINQLQIFLRELIVNQSI